MLNNARVSQFKKIYLAPGFTDLRRGIDGLAAIVRFQFSLNPYVRTLHLSSTKTDNPRCCFIKSKQICGV